MKPSIPTAPENLLNALLFPIYALVLMLSASVSANQIQDMKRLEFAEFLISEPEQVAVDALFDDQENSVWVDWGEDEGSIVNLTEQIISTGQLSASLVLDSDKELMISYAGKSHLFPLIMDNTAQHTTLLRLNLVLKPHYELRMAWDSNGGDTLAMIPLSLKQWSELEEKFGAVKVAHKFLKLEPHPNIFTETLIRPSEQP